MSSDRRAQVDEHVHGPYIPDVVDFAEAARIIAAQCALVRVRRASRALTRLYDDHLRESGLQASQLTMLAAIATGGDEGVPIGALADGLVMDRTTLTRNLAPLQKSGLVHIVPSPADARVKLVHLTRQGERAIEKAFPLWQRSEKRVRSQLGSSRVDAIREELGHVIAAATKGAEKATSARSRTRRS